MNRLAAVGPASIQQTTRNQRLTARTSLHCRSDTHPFRCSKSKAHKAHMVVYSSTLSEALSNPGPAVLPVLWRTTLTGFGHLISISPAAVVSETEAARRVGHALDTAAALGQAATVA